MKTSAANRFSKTNQPVICRGCQKKTTDRVQGSDTGLCRVCFEKAGLENEHEDGLHASPVTGCPCC